MINTIDRTSGKANASTLRKTIMHQLGPFGLLISHRVTFAAVILAGSVLAASGASAWQDGHRGDRGYSRGDGGGASVQQYERACVSGNKNACRELYRYANGLCLQGDDNACNYAEQVAQYIGQGYQPQQPQYRGDPMTPSQRGTVNEARGYIESKCDDPNLARQLQAFGFCQGR